MTLPARVRLSSEASDEARDFGPGAARLRLPGGSFSII
jgi:hypothetical protein